MLRSMGFQCFIIMFVLLNALINASFVYRHDESDKIRRRYYHLIEVSLFSNFVVLILQSLYFHCCKLLRSVKVLKFESVLLFHEVSKHMSVANQFLKMANYISNHGTKESTSQSRSLVPCEWTALVSLLLQFGFFQMEPSDQIGSFAPRFHMLLVLQDLFKSLSPWTYFLLICMSAILYVFHNTPNWSSHMSGAGNFFFL